MRRTILLRRTIVQILTTCTNSDQSIANIVSDGVNIVSDVVNIVSDVANIFSDEADGSAKSSESIFRQRNFYQIYFLTY